MSSRRTFFKIIVSVVALVLMLHISFSLISASPAAAAEQSKDDQIADLTQQIQDLNRMILELSQTREHILVLRIEQQCLGGRLSLQSTLIQIPVDKAFFDACQIGDDITDSPRISLLSSSLLAETRVYVDNKFTISR